MHHLLSLRWRMLIFSFSIVAVLTGLSLGAIRHFVAGRVERQILSDLVKTRSVLETFMRERASWLLSQCEVVAEDPRFTATVDIQDPIFEYQARTVLREARRFQSIIGSDVLWVTNSEGRVLTRLEFSTLDRTDLSDLAPIARALEGVPAVGTFRLGGKDYPAAAVPITDGGRVIGALAIGLMEEVSAAALLDELASYAANEQMRGSLVAADIHTAPLPVREVFDAFGSDLVNLVAVADVSGRALALVVREESYGEDLSTSPLIRDALSGQHVVGMHADQGRIVQLVSAPVWSQGKITGVLGTGFDIDDRLARDLRAMTQSEVSFALNGHVVASTWSKSVRRSLEDRIFAAGSPYAGRTDAFEIDVGGETFVSQLGPLEDLKGDSRGST